MHRERFLYEKVLISSTTSPCAKPDLTDFYWKVMITLCPICRIELNHGGGYER